MAVGGRKYARNNSNSINNYQNLLPERGPGKTLLPIIRQNLSILEETKE